MDRSAFLLASAAAVGSAALPAAAQTAVPLNIATIPIDSLAQAYYGKDNGWFARAGIDPNITTMANGAAVAAAVTAGSIDIGGSNVTSIAVAFAKGLPVTMIAGAGVYDNTAPFLTILVNKNSPIRTAKDLEGKFVAVSPLGSIGQFAPELWMEKNGADPSKVKWVELTFPTMEAALVAGRIDAAVDNEPYITLAKPTTRSIGRPFTAVAPEFMSTCWFTSTLWAKAHPDLVAKFAAIMRETAIWANKNKTQSGDILAKYTKIDRSVIADMVRVRYAEGLVPSLIQPNIDISVRYKAIENSFPAADLIFTPGK